MASGPYQAASVVTEFATRYYDALNRLIAKRMQRLGIPDAMIGIQNYPGIGAGPFVRFPYTQIGGNINPYLLPGRPAGIALDHGIFDADHPQMSNVPSWRGAALRDRIDAAIVHEYIEATLQPLAVLQGLAAAKWLHEEAVSRAPDTTIAITPGAQRILTEYRRAEGLAS